MPKLQRQGSGGGGTTPRGMGHGEALPRSRVRRGRRNIPAARITEDNRGRVCGRGRAGLGEDRGVPVCGEGRGGLQGGCLRLPRASPEAAGTHPAALCKQGRQRPRDAAPVPEGCSGWSQVPAGLGLFPEPFPGVGGCYFAEGEMLWSGLALRSWRYPVRHDGASVGFRSSWSLWCVIW